MGFFDLFRLSTPDATVSDDMPPETGQSAPMAMAGETAMFNGLNDPALLEFIRTGNMTTVKEAMSNPAVRRCVTLISFSIGMLPAHVLDSESKMKAVDHPMFDLLHRQPNNWQTAFNFRQLMQRRALILGNAYAMIIRSRGRVERLVPLEPDRITARQRNDWSVEYVYRKPDGGERVLAPEQVLHVYADSEDGITGTSTVKAAAEAIDLAMQTDRAASRLFKNGMMVGGALTHPGKLGPEAIEHLRASMDERYSGAENAHRWMILEEGMDAKQFSSTARDGQQIETRRHQVEEIGRAFGVPRPFLGVDDTSWGTGIDILGQIFVRYALNPWFAAWEQAIERSCFNADEKRQFEVKFNAGALIRGSMKDQAEFFAKALGSGGHQPWTDYQEVRDTLDLPEKEIAPNPLTQQRKESTNEPA